MIIPMQDQMIIKKVLWQQKLWIFLLLCAHTMYEVDVINLWLFIRTYMSNSAFYLSLANHAKARNGGMVNW